MSRLHGNDALRNELLRLASLACGRASARSALVHATAELLDAAADTVIESAIACARSSREAMAIRIAAEEASETAIALRGSQYQRFRLFAIPVLARFDEALPESAMDQALSFNLQSVMRSFQSRAVVAFPFLFRFEELASLPLSKIRRAAAQLARNDWLSIHVDTASRDTTRREAIMRRSRYLLRFMVGERCLDQRQEEGLFSKAQGEYLRRVVTRSIEGLSLRGRVSVTQLTKIGLHAQLYEVMWRVQGAKLRDLEEDMLACQHISKPCLLLRYRSTSSAAEAEVAFVTASTVFDGKTHLIRLRPPEDLTLSVGRIQRMLKRCNVRVFHHARDAEIEWPPIAIPL